MRAATVYCINHGQCWNYQVLASWKADLPKRVIGLKLYCMINDELRTNGAWRQKKKTQKEWALFEMSLRQNRPGPECNKNFVRDIFFLSQDFWSRERSFWWLRRRCLTSNSLLEVLEKWILERTLDQTTSKCKKVVKCRCVEKCSICDTRCFTSTLKLVWGIAREQRGNANHPGLILYRCGLLMSKPASLI